ncbi:MAG: DUF427 domain-containing protein [Gemmatimonadota bacterium]
MARALWRGQVLAESDAPEELEGSLYFPPESVRWEHLRETTRETTCPWKGTARLYDVVVEGGVNPLAAWVYPSPTARAKHIGGHLAFWKGVDVER